MRAHLPKYILPAMIIGSCSLQRLHAAGHSNPVLPLLRSLQQEQVRDQFRGVRGAAGAGLLDGEHRLAPALNHVQAKTPLTSSTAHHPRVSTLHDTTLKECTHMK